MKSPYTIYRPDNVLQQGYLRSWMDIFGEIVRNRWLTFQLFKRDLLATYKQSFAGLFWALILPLLSVGTFILLNRSGIFTIGDINTPYSIYAILGMALWQLFSTGLLAGSGSLVKAGSMLVRINLSKKSLVIASLGQSLVSFLIQILLVAGLFIYHGFAPTPYIALLPVMVLPLIFLTTGLGLILSVLNGIMRDIGNVLSVLITFLMFLTPVLYAKPVSGIMATITRYNILYYLVAVPRDLILTGGSRELTGYFISALLAVFLMLICLFAFHLAETRITERI
jgi:lipopolysaccharide transport system permease protein